MHARRFTSLLVAGLLLSFSVARADTLLKDVTISGTLTVESSVSGQPPTVVKLTTRSLLDLFGMTTTKTADCAYYLTADNHIILADPTDTTVYGTLFQAQTNTTTSIDINSHKFQQCTTSSMLTDQLNGVVFTKTTVTKKPTATLEDITSTLTSGGKINSSLAILRATLTATIKLLPPS